MRFLYMLLGSVLTGLAFAAALPPADREIFGWFAFVPLFLAIRKQGFLWGFVSGMLSCLIAAKAVSYGLFWKANTVYVDDSWILFGFVLFGAVTGILGGIFAESKTLDLKATAIFAAVAVLLEGATLALLPVHLALTQHLQPLDMRIASVAGIWAVSYLLWFCNLGIVCALTLKSRRSYGVAAVIILSVLSAGAIGGQGAFNEDPSGTTVAAIQTESTELSDLVDLTKKANVDLTVWPEMSGQLAAPGGNAELLTRASAKLGHTAFVTTFRDSAAPLPHNTAALFYEGKESARYFKRRLFGGETKMHLAGSDAVVADWKINVGLNVCFDSCYPSVIRETVEKGAQIIALPTEDPPSINGAVEAFHAAYTPFRAAENGIPIIRANNGPYSMIADADGNTNSIGPGSILVSKVGPAHLTFYRRAGDWFLYLCAVVVGIGLLHHGTRRNRPIRLDLVDQRNAGSQFQRDDLLTG